MLMLAIELRRTTLRFTAPLLYLFGSIVGLVNSYPAIATWPNLSEAMLGVSHFLVPFVTGSCAWEALRTSRRRLQAIEDTSARPFIAAHAAQLFSAIIWITVTWFAIFLTVIIHAVTIGLYGTPQLAPLLHSLLLLLAFATIGMSVSHLMRTWIAIPVSVLFAIGIYALTFFTKLPQIIGWTNIFTHYVATDETTSNQLFFAALSIEALALTVVIATFTTFRTRQYRYTSALVALVAIGSLVAGGGIAIGQRGQPNQMVNEASLPMITVSSDDNRVELHLLEQYEPVKQDLLAAWSRVANLFSESKLAFTRLEQQENIDHLNAPHTFTRLYLNPAARDIAQSSIQSALFDIFDCYRDGTQPSGKFGVEGTVVVESWLLGRTDLDATAWSSNPDLFAALNWLNTLSPADARTWVRTHLTQITTCGWEREDFTAS